MPVQDLKFRCSISTAGIFFSNSGTVLQKPSECPELNHGDFPLYFFLDFFFGLSSYSNIYNPIYRSVVTQTNNRLITTVSILISRLFVLCRAKNSVKWHSWEIYFNIFCCEYCAGTKFAVCSTWGKYSDQHL